jgi:enoyl-CoA hydratase
VIDGRGTNETAAGQKGIVRFVAEGSIGKIFLSNPDRLNAISLSMWQSLDDAARAFAANDEIRCIVVAGEGGKAFASGADISEFDKSRSERDAAETYNRISRHAVANLASLPQPTIAMIEGYCIGGGMALALSCDLRIAADDARFAIPAARLGLGYDFVGIQKLVSVVGPAVAKMLFFSARQIGGAEALRVGLVNEIVPKAALQQYVDDLAGTIAANAPLTIKAAKLGINTAIADPLERNVEACRAAERACFASEDYAEGRRAFAEKRRPIFKGR